MISLQYLYNTTTNKKNLNLFILQCAAVNKSGSLFSETSTLITASV